MPPHPSLGGEQHLKGMAKGNSKDRENYIQYRECTHIRCLFYFNNIEAQLISMAAPIGDSHQAGLSFEQKRCELAEIDAPVAPDVAAGGLYVGIFITSGIEFPAEVGIGFVEEIILAYADP